MNPKKITIAVDGFSSCGKSTLARDLANKLHYIFIDSGAMYRAITLFALRNGNILHTDINEAGIIASLDSIEMHFERNNETGNPELYLNGTNVEKEIRTPEISALVSKISAISEVRTKLVNEQRKMGAQGGIVMDGRDIGSVVFPNAQLKLFVTAAIETRVERRFKELSDKGIAITRNKVRKNLLERDHLDSTRKISPLTRTEDSILIDNTELTRREQLEIALELVHGILLTKQ